MRAHTHLHACTHARAPAPTFLAPCAHVSSGDEAGCLMPYGDLHNYEPPPAPHITDVLDEEVEQGIIPTGTQAADPDAYLEALRCCGAESGARASGTPMCCCSTEQKEERCSSSPSSADGHPWQAGAGAPAAQPPQQRAPQQPDSAPAANPVCGDGSYDASCGMYKLYARRRYTAGDWRFSAGGVRSRPG